MKLKGAVVWDTTRGREDVVIVFVWSFREVEGGGGIVVVVSIIACGFVLCEVVLKFVW